MTYQLIEAHQCFDGIQSVYTHWSEETQSDMRFAIYLPPAAEQKIVPVLYWLSGLTCSEQNFITKAGAQRIAAELGLAIVVPDTSPRGLNLVGVTKEEYIGEAAGFYVDATEMPWVDHYRMYSYISNELPRVIAENFPIDKRRCGIFGHSMGGHGALTIGLRNHQLFRSLSAFAPICAPTQVSWGKNAFQSYLGENQRTWQQYDACHLIMDHPWPHGEILIDQGNADPYIVEQLKPDLFEAACMQVNVPLNLRMHEKYDHNYYFIATFIEDHLRFHAKNLSE
ncbi:S-formylglutathione hydrolase [Legionella maioricensis]|uniref:S-formylglutathione hydrolase n=1 Tax=Legionella maioricensis TaxID=2896528 RepID=A0A9X2CYN5_9GAMM|nr:S-formylglutathione hydrolase [Legionella maioricensis]MCL9683161.1 S-formylglutathione hydrolase [Legionella maioricensis]MCL9688060.1 S-formylglutathione hydrolase [Legionella maioricensis]